MEAYKETLWVDCVNEDHVNMADFYYFKDAFTEEELDIIEKEAMFSPPVKGKVSKNDVEDHSVRKSEIRWMRGSTPYTDGEEVHTGDDLVWLYRKIWTMIEEANRNLWNFNLTHGRDAIQHTIYKEGGGHYDWHMDCGANEQRQRKISVTVQLSDDEDYEGGELQLWRGANALDAPKGKGTVVIFPSYMMHRVTEVTKGTRKSLVLWVGGDHYR